MGRGAIARAISSVDYPSHEPVASPARGAKAADRPRVKSNDVRELDFAPGRSVAAFDLRSSWLGLDFSPVLGLVSGLLEDAATTIRLIFTNLVAQWRQHHQMVSQSLGGTTKRVCDIGIASTALFLMLPLMLIVAATIRYQMGGPVIFAHRRIGFQGRAFGCLKFRTMVNDGESVLEKHLARFPEAAKEWQDTRKLKDDPRVTKLGKFLRRSSIDELPQLWNVMIGDMSCVGPRPIVASELERYGRAGRHYLNARPGITGMWQVSGRSNTNYKRRVALDRLYWRQWSIWRDVELLILTVPAVLRTSEAV